MYIYLCVVCDCACIAVPCTPVVCVHVECREARIDMNQSVFEPCIACCPERVRVVTPGDEDRIRVPRDDGSTQQLTPDVTQSSYTPSETYVLCMHVDM